MIEHRVGDVLTVPERPVIIAHVVNDIGRFGRGVAAAIRHHLPQAARAFDDWAAGRLDGDAPVYWLGQVLFVSLPGGITVAHMVAQHRVRSASNPHPIRYDHLETCLRTVADVARRDTMVGEATTVAIPKIGSGLAGGDWDRIEPIVAQTLTGQPVAIYTLTP